jgi:hypothetical protein
MHVFLARCCYLSGKEWEKDNIRASATSSHIIFERDAEEASKAEQRSLVRFLTAEGVGGREIHRRMERILWHLIEAQKITQIEASWFTRFFQGTISESRDRFLFYSYHSRIERSLDILLSTKSNFVIFGLHSLDDSICLFLWQKTVLEVVFEEKEKVNFILFPAQTPSSFVPWIWPLVINFVCVNVFEAIFQLSINVSRIQLLKRDECW